MGCQPMSDLPVPLITISPEYLGGEPVFTGTRVPVQALFGYIKGGDPLGEFCPTSPTFPGSMPSPCSKWGGARP
jgi:hypothetical protein